MRHDHGIEPDAVVPDRAPHVTGFAIDPDDHAACVGVFDDVGDGLLNDTVERRLDDRRQTSIGAALDTYIDRRAPGHPLGQELERRNEPEIVEDGRTKLVGQAS